MNSRRKGADGERELSNVLKEYGYGTRRGQQYCGANGDADVVGIPGLHIECKRVEKLNIDNAMDQSISDAKDGEIPVVIHRKNRRSWKVTMELEDFIKLWKKDLSQ
jgi:Holliday junction resolvase